MLNFYISRNIHEKTAPSCEAVTEAANRQLSTPAHFTATLDGQGVPDIKGVSAGPCFDLYGALAPQLQGVPAYPSAAAGFWVLLSP